MYHNTICFKFLFSNSSNFTIFFNLFDFLLSSYQKMIFCLENFENRSKNVRLQKRPTLQPPLLKHSASQFASSPTSVATSVSSSLSHWGRGTIKGRGCADGDGCGCSYRSDGQGYIGYWVVIAC